MMLTKGLKLGSALVCLAAIPVMTGCAHCKKGGTKMTGWPAKRAYHAKTVSLPSEYDMPSYAKPGECYERVYVEPQFETVSDRVCVREASERVEVIPAQYEWTEERVLVKEASTEYVEIPAKWDVQYKTVQTNPGYDTWVKANEAHCNADAPGPQDVFCLVSEPPTSTTIPMHKQIKAGTVKKVSMPAEYQTIRRQKLVRPSSTRTVKVPAEYRDVTKTVMVNPGQMSWRKVACGAEAVPTNVRPVSYRGNNYNNKYNNKYRDNNRYNNNHNYKSNNYNNKKNNNNYRYNQGNH